MGAIPSAPLGECQVSYYPPTTSWTVAPQQQPQPQPAVISVPSRLSSSEYLPYGWEVKLIQGRKFYVDHTTRKTHWVPPWLPQHWEMHVDPRSRLPYYLNLNTRSSQWQAPIPPGWQMLFEPKYGRPYLRDTTTGQSTWDNPLNSVMMTDPAVCAQQQQQTTEMPSKTVYPNTSLPGVVPTITALTSTPVSCGDKVMMLENDKLSGGNDSKSTATATTPKYESLMCKVCMENQIDVVLLECGHLCVCSGCATKLSTCPICRGPIKSTLHVYAS